MEIERKTQTTITTIRENLGEEMQDLQNKVNQTNLLNSNLDIKLSDFMGSPF
jgi:hypothetical protein